LGLLGFLSLLFILGDQSNREKKNERRQGKSGNLIKKT